MKYVQFYYNDCPEDIYSGYIVCNDVVDINKYDATIPRAMIDILKEGYICQVNRLICSPLSPEPRSDITLVAPITGMDKVICCGLNYVDYCAVANKIPPSEPMFYAKFPSCIIGPNEPIKMRTGITDSVDWEVGLAVVIKTKCSDVLADQALNYVFGYTIAQDITSRDWETQNSGQFLLGKAQDTFCPIGPWIVTPDEVGDPHRLGIRCSVNNRIKQNSNTTNLIHSIPNMIQKLSSVMTLLPGDIIMTGTPAGSGFMQSPPEFLQPGDVIRSEIQNIGVLNLTVESY